MREAFGNIIDRHGHAEHGPEGQEKRPDGEDHVVVMVFDTGAEDSQAGGDEDGGDPQAVEAVLRFPDAAAASADPEGEAVID